MNETNSFLQHPDAFLNAILSEDLKEAKACLPSGDDINRRYGPNGWIALHYAVEHMASSSVSWLLENGANPNERDVFGQTPLHLAIDIEADSAAQEQLKIGTMIMSADLTKLLLEHGADPNAQTKKGKTPLAWAISMNHTEAINLLKSHGAR